VQHAALAAILTRIFTILFNSGTRVLAISITFLGLGSAEFASMSPARVRAALERAADPALALAYAIALLLGSTCCSRSTIRRPARSRGHVAAQQVVGVTIASLLLLPAMFLSDS